ncbi:MAG TPA: hypothetical protein VFY64_02970 [Nitrososphaeraceae archaeon]|nr:hypothetical protein [Nitrososphaeraceae archaeon]
MRHIIVQNLEEALPSPPLLKTLENMLYNRIAQKKREMHKATERAVTDKIWTEIETLQWVLGQSLNVRRQMEPNEGRYHY